MGVHVFPIPICLYLFLFLLPWETDLRKHWYSLCQGMFCLSSLEGVFGYLIFRSIILFELIFVYGVTVCSNFLDLHVVASTFPVLPAEKTIVYSFLLCWRLIDCRYVGLFLGSLFCSIDAYVCFCANTTLFCFVFLLSLHRDHANLLFIIPILVYVLPEQAQYHPVLISVAL